MSTTRVAEVMNSEVLKVRDDFSLEELAVFLVDHEISGAPVEDAGGRLVGVVSVVDLAAATAGRGALGTDRGSQADYFVRGWQEPIDEKEMQWLRIADGGRRVRDIMRTEVCSVTEDAPVSKAARLMREAHIHRLLVLREGKMVGIVSSSDLLALLVDEAA